VGFRRLLTEYFLKYNNNENYSKLLSQLNKIIHFSFDNINQLTFDDIKNITKAFEIIKNHEVDNTTDLDSKLVLETDIRKLKQLYRNRVEEFYSTEEKKL